MVERVLFSLYFAKKYRYNDKETTLRLDGFIQLFPIMYGEFLKQQWPGHRAL